jgi:D-alanine-D-alanine ligase
LAGKEYSVGIFEDSIDGTLTAMPIEIIVKQNMDGHCILDFDVKKNDEESVIIVSDVAVSDKLSKLAKDSFKALGGKSLGRIDIKMNHLGEPHFIEANLMPGLRKGYFYRSCVLNLNMSYDDMIFSIANTGLSSH